MLTRKQMAPAIALLVTLISVYLHFTYGQAAVAKSNAMAVELVQR